MAKAYGFQRREDVQRVGRVVRRVERSQQGERAERARLGSGWFDRILVCHTTEAATQGSFATCEILDGPSYDDLSGTGQNIEVFFLLGDADNDVDVLVAETVRGYVALNIACPA